MHDLIDSWRNDFIHGKEYWQNRTPIIANLICLLVIDEIDPSIYDTKLGGIRLHLEWKNKMGSYGVPNVIPDDLYPPDLHGLTVNR